MRGRIVIPGALVGVWFALACGTDEGVLATVGDSSVAVAAFQQHLVAASGEAWQGVTDPVASRLLDQFIDQEVVVAAAVGDDEMAVPVEPGARLELELKPTSQEGLYAFRLGAKDSSCAEGRVRVRESGAP